MSLLKKYFAATTEQPKREVVYVTLINAVPSKPVLVNGEDKARMCITISSDGEQRDMYLFRDAIAGLPSFIPQGGVNAMLTLQQSEEINPKTGDAYVNAVALGVGA